MIHVRASLLCVPLCCASTPTQAPTDAQRLAKAVNTFAADLRGTFAPTTSPTFSPTSLGVALLMLLPGARGDTANEIATMLHLPADLRGRRLHDAVAELLDDACLVGLKINAAVDVPRPVVLANDLWVAPDAPLLPEFVATLRQSFSAGYETIEFSDAAAARRRINESIARQTRGRITDLVPDGAIQATTKLVLTNALRLHLQWREPFAAGQTTDRAFTLADGTAVQVPTMRGTCERPFADTGPVQVLALALERGELAVEIAVPAAGGTLADAEQALFEGAFRLQHCRVTADLPRFEVRSEHRLAPALQSLGMKIAFDAERADFGAMTGAGPLFVGAVLQKAFVKVDENGLEAAAATAAVLKPGARMPPDPPRVFRADRPFAFAVRHAPTGLLLFVGRVDDPRRKQA